MTKRNATRNATPPSVPTIKVSEFVRGGIYNLDQPTTVVSHGEELGTWYPRGQGASVFYGVSSTPTVLAAGSSSSFTGMSNDAIAPVLAGLTESINALRTTLTSNTTTTNEDESNG